MSNAFVPCPKNSPKVVQAELRAIIVRKMESCTLSKI